MRNAAYLETRGAALHADSVEAVEATVGGWLSDPAELRRRREAARSLGHPNAAADIARHVLDVAAANGHDASPRRIALDA